MNGQVLLDLLTQILSGEGPNQAYMLQLMNLARIKFESMRPWKCLSSVDSSLIVTGANTYLIPFNLPTDFYRYLGESSLAEGSIVLFNPGTYQKVTLTEVPIEQILNYRTEFGKFAVDYKNKVFYICGIVPGSYNIYQYYIRRTLPITLSTQWENFPADYAPILAFDAAARWRLGTDYDDVASMNATDNGQMVKALLDAMGDWDTELALASVNSIDYTNNRPGYLNNSRGPYYNGGGNGLG